MLYDVTYRDIELTVDEIEEANAMEMDHQRWAENAWADLKAALARSTKLKVERVEGGFEIVLRSKNKEKTSIKLHSRVAIGGLFTEDGTVILHAYEFSMHKYQQNTDVRAATEYVRRKLTKLGR